MEFWEISEEKEVQACAVCKGPFDYWGTSRGFSLYRCQVCKLIHFVEMGNPASLIQETAEPAIARAGSDETALRGHKITLREAGDIPIHAFIGTAGAGESPEFESLDANPEEDSSVEDADRTASLPGHKNSK